MGDIQREIEAFEEMKPRLEAEHMGRWALVHHRQLVNTFASFVAAADAATRRFGREPYLIRRIGVHSVRLPASPGKRGYTPA